MSRVWRLAEIIEDARTNSDEKELVFDFQWASTAPERLPDNIGSVVHLTRLIVENSR